MNKHWQKLSEDFLSFTLENSGNSPLENLKLNDFTATLLGEGLLFLMPEKGEQKQPLILASGIHGNETAPMELLQQWCADIFSGVLKLSLPVLFIIGNPAAARKSKRFIDENLNRLFSSEDNQKESNLERARAELIMQQLDKLNEQYSWKNVIHFDLHTAIRPSKEEKFLVLPFKADNSHNQKLLDFWAACGLTAALRADRPAKTFSYFTQSQFNAISATVELGKVAAFGENDLNKLSGVDHGIRQFISTGQWPISENKKTLKLFQVKKELIKTSENFELFIESDFANFSSFENGYLLAQDKTEGFEFRISSEKEVLVFPNNQIPVGQRAGLVAELI